MGRNRLCMLSPYTTIYAIPLHDYICYPFTRLCMLSPYTTMYAIPLHDYICYPLTRLCMLSPYTTMQVCFLFFIPREFLILLRCSSSSTFCLSTFFYHVAYFCLVLLSVLYGHYLFFCFLPSPSKYIWTTLSHLIPAFPFALFFHTNLSTMAGNLFPCMFFTL